MASPGRGCSLSDSRVMLWHLHICTASWSFRFAVFFVWWRARSLELCLPFFFQLSSPVCGGRPWAWCRKEGAVVSLSGRWQEVPCGVRASETPSPAKSVPLSSGFSLSGAALLTSIQRRRPRITTNATMAPSRLAGSGGSEQARRCSSASGTTAACFSVTTALERQEEIM